MRMNALGIALRVARYRSCAALAACLLLTAAGCKTGPWSTPGTSFATWGKKDTSALAATKPSPNFPTTPSKNATPNAVASTAVNGGPGAARSGNPNGQGPDASYPLASTNQGGPGGAQSERGFYASTPPGSNLPGGNPSKWDAANSGYLPGNTGGQRGGYDYQPASLRESEYAGGNDYNSPDGGEFGSSPIARATNQDTGGYQNHRYAPPPGSMPVSVRPPGYGPPGQMGYGQDHGYEDDHDHGDAGYAPPGGYGSPGKTTTPYDSGRGFAPPGYSAYGESDGEYAEYTPDNLPMPAGLTQSGNGYLPGSTRRGVGGPANTNILRPGGFAMPTNVRPVGFSDEEDDEYQDDSETSSWTPGGSFGEPGDSYGPRPPARFGGNNGYDWRQ